MPSAAGLDALADPNLIAAAKSVLLLAIGGGGGAGLWAWLSTRTKGNADVAVARVGQPADMLAAQTAFQTALNAQANAFIDELVRSREATEGRAARLADKVEELEAEVRDLRKEHEAELSDLRAKHQQCEGENRGMAQRIDSLASYLRRAGIEVPEAAMPGSFVQIEGNRTTTLTPMPKRTARRPRKAQSGTTTSTPHRP